MKSFTAVGTTKAMFLFAILRPSEDIHEENTIERFHICDEKETS